MLEFIKKIIFKIENQPISFYLWVATFFSLIASRLFVENVLFGMKSTSGSFIFYECMHTFLFFLISYLIFLWLLKGTLSLELKNAANLLILGFWFILTPPVIDFIISGGRGFWSFYEFDGIVGLVKRFFTFFGEGAHNGITYGVRIEVAVLLLALFVLAYVKSKSIVRAMKLTLIYYLIFFILGTFPSYITIIKEGITKGFLVVSDLDIASMFLSPAKIFSQEAHNIKDALNLKMSLVYTQALFFLVGSGLFFNYRQKFLVFLKNSRPAQSIYHLGLLLIGAGLGIYFTEPAWNINIFNILAFLNIMLAVWLAWLTSVVVNDIFDQKIDATSNKNRPLIQKEFTVQEYFKIGIVLFFFSILSAMIVSFKIALLLIVYQAVAWSYSAPPLRLKRFTLVSTIISAVASILIFIVGYALVAREQDITRLPSQFLWLLFISLTLSLPIKDLKDIAGDRIDNIKTIPVVFGKYWGKMIIAVGVFISYILSVLLLNEPKLFWWAILCGTVSFLIVNSCGDNQKITQRNVIWWVMSVVAIYAMIIFKLIFLI